MAHRMTQVAGATRFSPEACATKSFPDTEAGKAEIFVGKSTLIRAILRVSAPLGRKILRNGRSRRKRVLDDKST